MGFLPANVREAEAQVAERGADRDVGERNVGAKAIGFLAQFLGHEFQAARDLAVLAGDPVVTLLAIRAFAFEEGGGGGVADAIGDELPSA